MTPKVSPPPESQDASNLREEMVALMPSLRAFGRSLCGNPSRADDLVQDTLVKALSNLDRFEAGSNLRAWLFTILRNTFFTDLRKGKREVEDPDGAFAARVLVPPSQMGVVDFEDFKAAFQRLSPDHREALTLIGALGVSYEDAAAICGCAIGTIKSRVNRARGQLTELLGLEAQDLAAIDSGPPNVAPEQV